MKKQIIKLLICTLFILSGMTLAQDPAEFQGYYAGSETLAGGSSVPSGTYALKIKISAKGKIKITDVDNISGFGKLEGNYFKVVRKAPKQIFEGTILDGVITGTTWGNKYTGDGTFTAELQE